MTRKILLIADKDNSKYYQQARRCLDGASTFTPKISYPSIRPYLLQCKREHINTIILSSSEILDKLITHSTGKESKDNSNLNKWAGAILDYEGLKILVAKPFKQLVTMDSARFLLKWYYRKLLLQSYYTPPPMVWSVCDTHGERTQALARFSKAEYMAVDIETTLKEISEVRYQAAADKGKPVSGLAVMVKQKDNKPDKLCIPMIDMIGYTALFQGANGDLYSETIVLHIRTLEDIQWMRKFNNTQATKICQNGGYEATHLIRYNAPLRNWLGDTFHFAHCQFVEVARTLGDLAAMWLGNFEYWKDEISSQRAHYNAKDTYTTLWIYVFQVREAARISEDFESNYAAQNYLIEFRKCFPFITCGLEGMKVDLEERKRLRTKYHDIKSAAETRLQKLLYKDFNPASPPQVLAVMNAFTKQKFKKTDDKALEKWAEIGPLQAYISEAMQAYRMSSKKLSTYIDARLFEGRMLYELNAGGTDTGRASSKASNLWCGTNIQNQDNKLRSMYIPDEGMILANQDGSQAESRTTAYISEDANLIHNVETAPDFHARNASMFFGMPESDIIRVRPKEETEIDGATGAITVFPKGSVDVINPFIRKLSKPVNHGSNYNMAEGMLLMTMGVKLVLKAKKALGLDPSYSLTQVCTHLLQAFMNTYPDIKGKYYDEVFEEIATTGRLVGATGWTRICFGRPIRGGHKPTINKYVAHGPQSLSVMILDEACFDFWLEWQIEKNVVRTKAQVHDEVVYQCDPKDLAVTQEALGKLVSRPYQVRGRSLVIPTDGGGNGYRWSDLK